MVNDNFNKLDIPDNDSDKTSTVLAADVDHKLLLAKTSPKAEDSCSLLDLNDSIESTTASTKKTDSTDTTSGEYLDCGAGERQKSVTFKDSKLSSKDDKVEGEDQKKKAKDVPPALKSGAPRPGDGEALPHRLTDEEAKDPKLNQFSRKTLEAVRKEINELGTDPKKAVIESAKNNRVVAFGEKHVTPNPQREFGASIMADLEKAGITHLAIEVPVTSKDAIDNFWKTGNIDKKDLPKDLQHDDFIKLLKAARDAGIQPVAVDRAKPDLERQINAIPIGGRLEDDLKRSSLEAELASLGGSRDNHMAKSIKSILDADKNNKVAFWVGSRHLEIPEKRDYNDGAVVQLREKYGFAVAAFADEGGYYPDTTVARITNGLTRDVAVPVAKAKHLGGLTVTGGHPDYANDHYKNYQNLLIYAKRPAK